MSRVISGAGVEGQKSEVRGPQLNSLCSFSPKNLTGQAGARACPPLEGSALKTLI